MLRKQRSKLFTFVLTMVMVTGSFGTAASAAQAGAAVPDESFVVSEAQPETPAAGGTAEAAEAAAATEASAVSEETEAAEASAVSEEAEAAEASAVSEEAEASETSQEASASSDAEAAGQAGTPEETPAADGAATSGAAGTNAGAATGGTAAAGGTDAGAATGGAAEATGSDADAAGSDAGATAGGTAEMSGEGSTEGLTAGAPAVEERVFEAAVTEVDLSKASVSLVEGKTAKLKVTVGYSCEDLETLTKTLGEVGREDVVWSSSDAKAAAVSAGSAVKVSIDAGQEEAPFEGIVTQEVTVSAKKEGKASISVVVAGNTEMCDVTVKPLIKVLGSPENVAWTNTTELTWEPVDSAEKYRVTLYLKKGAVKYSKVLYVTGRTSYDLEEEIVSLIKANRKNFTGAAYTISASVQAQSTDKKHFENGKASASPSFRYLRTTYLEALEKNGWYERNGNWYYYDTGVMQKGWISFAGARYYLNKDGIMQKNRWISGVYVKSDGAMAKNEWVDGYKTYVGANGRIDTSVTFSEKNWVQTKAGWRYKKTDGKFVKNTWYPIGHRMYYFDAAGHLVTGWLKLDGNTYYLKNSGTIETGRGARQSGWQKIGSSFYWFDKDGVMAKSQWVDRGQYYVSASGRRQNWITYGSLRNVGTSNRLGYDIYSRTSPPEQSIPAYDLAYQNGNRILVVDLRFTKDNVPVCFHDDLVKYARTQNGNEPGQKPSVSGLTYAELSKFDFGIYRGAPYKGTAPLTLETMAAWIKKHTDAELYIEVKADTMTAAQVKNLATVLTKAGITNQTSAIFTVSNANDTRALRVHRQLPLMRIGITTTQVGTLAYSQLDKVRGSNETFIWGWDTTALSATAVKTLISKNAAYECGIFSDSLEEMLGYYTKGSVYAYNTGVETAGAVFKTLLSAATYHDKAQWVSTDQGWKYQKIDKTFLKKSWLTLGSKRYYLNASGIMQTGWLNLGGKLYYMDSDGTMVTGWKYVGAARYYFGADGVMLTGKQVLNGHTYLFDSKGKYVKKVS